MIPGRANSTATVLDRRVTLQEPVTTRDTVGGQVVSWVDIATVWAAKRFLSGGRLYAAEEKHYESLITYRIRHRLDVAGGCRLIAGDDIFEIAGEPEEIGRRQFLDLTCRAIDQSTGDDRAYLDAGDRITFLDAGDGTTFLDVGVAA